MSQKILYVILHGINNKHRYNNVVETWGKYKNLLFYADYDDEEKKVIKLSENTNYSSNEEKHVNVFKYLVDMRLDYEWFFFCDDDTFVNTKKLESMLDDFEKDRIHGQILKIDNIKGSKLLTTLDYCSGGAGYLISKNLIELISKEIKLLNSGFADVTLGVCLKSLNIPISNSELFKGQPPIFYGLDYQLIEKYISFHYIKTKEDMQKLFENVQ